MSQLYGKMDVDDGDELCIDVRCIGCGYIIILKKRWGQGNFRGECESCHIKYSASDWVEITVDDHSGNSDKGFGQ